MRNLKVVSNTIFNFMLFLIVIYYLFLDEASLTVKRGFWGIAIFFVVIGIVLFILQGRKSPSEERIKKKMILNAANNVYVIITRLFLAVFTLILILEIIYDQLPVFVNYILAFTAGSYFAGVLIQKSYDYLKK